MTKVFISYSRQDREFAGWLKDALTRAGIGASLDVFDLEPGADFASAIRDAIQTADAVVAIVSDSPIAGYVGVEIGMAVGLGKRVVAVLAPGKKPDPPLLRSIADAYVLDAANLKPTELGAAVRKALQGQQMGD
jgi:hypothetical protein